MIRALAVSGLYGAICSAASGTEIAGLISKRRKVFYFHILPPYLVESNEEYSGNREVWQEKTLPEVQSGRVNRKKC